MKIKQLIPLLALTAPFAANADFLSISAGGGLWYDTPGGTYQGADTNDDLAWSEESQGYLFVTFEHFVPIIPNARLSYTSLDHTGSDTSGPTAINNELVVEMTDLLLYYEVLDNIVSLDLGLNIRNLKFDFVTSDASLTSHVDETFPMLYALVGASPWPDLIVSGELSIINFDGIEITDFIAKVAYTTNSFVGFEAGYRHQKLVLDDVDNTNADLTFDGGMAQV